MRCCVQAISSLLHYLVSCHALCWMFLNYLGTVIMYFLFKFLPPLNPFAFRFICLPIIPTLSGLVQCSDACGLSPMPIAHYGMHFRVVPSESMIKVVQTRTLILVMIKQTPLPSDKRILRSESVGSRVYVRLDCNLHFTFLSTCTHITFRSLI